MPKEVRYFLFSSEELYQALATETQLRGIVTTTGALEKMKISDDGCVRVTLQYISKHGGARNISFDSDEVKRALIRYCNERGIPLPAKAAKWLEVRGGLVGLLCTLNFGRDNVVFTPEAVTYKDADSDPAMDAAAAALVSAGA